MRMYLCFVCMSMIDVLSLLTRAEWHFVHDFIFLINWLITEATPTSATRKTRRAVEREQLCARLSRP